jgi:RNA recognition motif-containing protein
MPTRPNYYKAGNARRTLGYAFVAFEDEEHVPKAIEAMHQKDLKGRELNVVVAAPYDPDAPRPARRGRERGRGGIRVS